MLDLATGEPLANTAESLPQQVASGLQWGADNATLFYLTQDATQRPYKLWRHRLGGGGGEDQVSLAPRSEPLKWPRKELSA